MSHCLKSDDKAHFFIFHASQSGCSLKGINIDFAHQEALCPLSGKIYEGKAASRRKQKVYSLFKIVKQHE